MICNERADCGSPYKSRLSHASFTPIARAPRWLARPPHDPPGGVGLPRDTSEAEPTFSLSSGRGRLLARWHREAPTTWVTRRRRARRTRSRACPTAQAQPTAAQHATTAPKTGWRSATRSDRKALFDAFA